MELGMIVLLQPCINVLLAVSMSALQLSRESYAMLPLSTTMAVKPLQALNADLPMEVTDLGMNKLVKLWQLRKA